MIKPKPLQAPVAGGFTVDDFTVDEQAGTVTCPAGHTVALSRTRIATFGVACRANRRLWDLSKTALGELITRCAAGVRSLCGDFRVRFPAER